MYIFVKENADRGEKAALVEKLIGLMNLLTSL